MNSCFTLFAGADGDNLYFYTSGEYKVPDDADWENVDYADYRFANLDVYDKYGNLIKTIDLYHSIDFSSVAYEGQQISEIYYHPFCVNTIKDGKVGLKASAYMLPFELSKDIDPAIIVIVNEEMPAYFTGQKSFDDVVNLINNRVTTVLNEQG